MVREGIPQSRRGGTKGSIAHSWEPGLSGLKEVGGFGTKVTNGAIGDDKFFEVVRGSAIEAFVGQQGDFIFNPLFDREPVEGFKDGGDVVVLPHSHQDPGSTVLDEL